MLSACYWSVISHYVKHFIYKNHSKRQIVSSFLSFFFLFLFPFSFPSPFHLLILPFIKSDDHILATWACKIFTSSMIQIVWYFSSCPRMQPTKKCFSFHDTNSRRACLMNTLPWKIYIWIDTHYIYTCIHMYTYILI